MNGVNPKIEQIGRSENKTPLYNYAITCICELINDVNKTPKINSKSGRYPSRNVHRGYYRVWWEIILSQSDYSKTYKDTRKRING